MININLIELEIELNYIQISSSQVDLACLMAALL